MKRKIDATDTSTHNRLGRNWLRLIARVLILCWVGFWGFFLVASLLCEPFKTGGLIPIAIYLLLFIVPVFIVWRWERIGGVLLLLIGHAILFGYPLLASKALTTVVMVYLTMAFPALISGLLFFLSGRKSIPLQVSQNHE